jgi:hypothetical protein
VDESLCFGLFFGDLVGDLLQALVCVLGLW